MLSIVLPVLNEGEKLQEHLHALQVFRDSGCELIGVDGGSTDHSFKLLQQYCDNAIVTTAGRAQQMNAGAQLAQGGRLLFLHADTYLPKNTQTVVEQALRGADWGRFDVALDAEGVFFQVIGGLMNWRSRWTKVCTGDQALFFNTAFFHALKGYPEISLMEDVAISKLARSKGVFAALNAQVITSARRWQNNGVLKTIVLMWELRLRYFLGQSPDDLLQRYYG